MAAKLTPGGVVDLDALLAPLLLARVFDLARIEHTGAAFGGRRRLEVAREQERSQKGVEIDDATWGQLRRLAADYGIAASLGLS